MSDPHSSPINKNIAYRYNLSNNVKFYELLRNSSSERNYFFNGYSSNH